ncbi:MAG: citrate/2-methylcitrate synthase [Acutalibacteraceae bacterium]|nr:citrate/2-methylcitrate synthase [Acutalibacteraceae bacterium]
MPLKKTIKDFSAISDTITKYSELCVKDCHIRPEMYIEHKVNRGLRDLNGKGVITGLTEISEINSRKIVDGQEVLIPGELFYRGYPIEELVEGFVKDNRFGFEETIYLILFGELPAKEDLAQFNTVLSGYRSLPNSFVRDIIMKAPSNDMMNSLARSVLTLYSYDADPNNTSVPNVLRQCLQLIATFPMLSVYSYHSYNYYIRNNNSFFIHNPDPNLSTAENILHMLRIDSKYTPLEAKLLDLALVLHAEHGGGNNSTFTTHVVSSSGTDTYSAIAAALGSLKGPKHGGANIKVCTMFEDIKKNVKNWEDRQEVFEYLKKLLRKEAGDRSGLIYGMGHAVYSVSDPRAAILKNYVKSLSEEKGLDKEYGLYTLVEELAPKAIAEERKIYKGVSANIDFYSGFVYDMLNLPHELYTPLFAIARIVGWSAHRLEELINAGKIIRPAYIAVQPRREYVELGNRD